MAELRWILLGLGLLLIGGIWWRGTRRSGQARGDVDLAASTVVREPVVSQAHTVASVSLAETQTETEEPAPAPEERDWGISPLDPLSIKTADFDDVPVLDTPMIVEMRTGADEVAAPKGATPAPTPLPAAAEHPPQAAVAAERAAPVVRTDNSGRFATPAVPPNAKTGDKQKIVSLRICALGDDQWSGKRLVDALELQGLAFGRYQVFHRNHVDGRSLFCVASLIEPGTFDPDAMLDQEFRGITAFAVLPGPLEPVQTVEALIATARRLAESLTGMVQDGRGVPLSPQRAAALRDEVARFQAGLS